MLYDSFFIYSISMLKEQVDFDETPTGNSNEWKCNRKRQFVLVAAVVLVIVLACTVALYLTLQKTGNKHNNNHIRREKLLKYLHEVSESKRYISGVSCGYPINPKLQNVSKITKVFPGIITTSLPRNTANSTEWKSFIEDLVFTWNNHHLVHIYWWANNPYGTSMMWDSTTIEEKWNELMTEGSFLNTKWMEQLDFVAPYLLKLQTAGVVPFLDILPKINQNRLPSIWTGRPGVNGSAKLYKMTQDYLKEKHNYISVIWALSVRNKEPISDIEKYWPGDDYVDVVSVYMIRERGLTTNEYQELVNFVGDKPMSMESRVYVPSTQLLTAQPRWTWYNVEDYSLNNSYNAKRKVRATFNSISVNNAGHITYFDDINWSAIMSLLHMPPLITIS